MIDRRRFLHHGATALMAISAPGCSATWATHRSDRLKTTEPRRALVMWYSQAGNTARAGRLIAKVWEKQGLEVTAEDMREVTRSAVRDVDLVVVGTPVFYGDVPTGARRLIAAIPEIAGVPVASFVTFGGPGDNQHNTACSLLELLSEKGGVPVGLATFGNMSTFAPTWSMGSEERVLAYRHRPDDETFAQIRAYAEEVLEVVAAGLSLEVTKETTLINPIRGAPQIWGIKLLIGEHTIDRELCVECGTCAEKCPVRAALPLVGRIDRERCVACMGCVNNCPEGAIQMTFMGSRVYGFPEFLAKHSIEIKEPPELG